MSRFSKVAAAAIDLGVNVGLPYVVYVLAKPRVGDVHALLAAMVPPLLWSGIEFARARRIDAVSMLVIAGIALSLLAFFGGGSARFLQLRENLVTGLIGVVFLVSAAIGRPLIYQLALAATRRKGQGEEAKRLEALRAKPQFRRTMMRMTLVWGCGLILQTAVACVLVFHMSIQRYLIVSPIVGYGMLGLLMLWTFWYGNRMKRRGMQAASSLSPTTKIEA